MPAKKQPSKRSRAQTDGSLRAAIASGQSTAEEVIAFRAKQRRKRAALERKAAPARRRAVVEPAPIPAKTRALLGS